MSPQAFLSVSFIPMFKVPPKTLPRHSPHGARMLPKGPQKGAKIRPCRVPKRISSALRHENNDMPRNINNQCALPMSGHLNKPFGFFLMMSACQRVPRGYKKCGFERDVKNVPHNRSKRQLGPNITPNNPPKTVKNL